MRIGKEVTSLSEDEYSILLWPIGNKIGTRIKVKGQDFYKIGDFMTYMGKKIVITEVDGQFKQGEMIFLYTLVDMPIREKSCNSSYSAGFYTVIDTMVFNTIGSVYRGTKNVKGRIKWEEV